MIRWNIFKSDKKKRENGNEEKKEKNIHSDKI